MEIEIGDAIPATETRKAKALTLLGSHILTRLAVLILLSLLVYLTIPRFLSPQNLTNIVRQASLTLIIAVGMTVVVITKGIDLSVGAVLTLTSVVGAYIMKQQGVPPYLGVAAALGLGLAFGLINGALVSVVRLPAFIATYGSMWVAQGLSLILLQGDIIAGFKPSFRFLGAGAVLGVPMPIVLMVGIALTVHLVLTQTSWGVHVYAVGGKSESAERAGISLNKTLIRAYALSGFLAAFAGMVLVSRLDTAEAGTGDAFLLPAIAMVCIGGTSLNGGEGSILGTILGGLIVTVIQNAMNLWGVSTSWQPFVIGALIVLSVLGDTIIRRWQR